MTHFFLNNNQMKNNKKGKTETNQNKKTDKESEIKRSLADLEYIPEEDIYNNAVETDLDPDDLTKKKAPNERPQLINEKDFNDDKTGGDLDVPGSELDDEQEEIGSE